MNKLLTQFGVLLFSSIASVWAGEYHDTRTVQVEGYQTVAQARESLIQEMKEAAISKAKSAVLSRRVLSAGQLKEFFEFIAAPVVEVEVLDESLVVVKNKLNLRVTSIVSVDEQYVVDTAKTLSNEDALRLEQLKSETDRLKGDIESLVDRINSGELSQDEALSAAELMLEKSAAVQRNLNDGFIEVSGDQIAKSIESNTSVRKSAEDEFDYQMNALVAELNANMPVNVDFAQDVDGQLYAEIHIGLKEAQATRFSELLGTRPGYISLSQRQFHRLSDSEKQAMAIKIRDLQTSPLYLEVEFNHRYKSIGYLGVVGDYGTSEWFPHSFYRTHNSKFLKNERGRDEVVLQLQGSNIASYRRKEWMADSEGITLRMPLFADEIEDGVKVRASLVRVNAQN